MLKTITRLLSAAAIASIAIFSTAVAPAHSGTTLDRIVSEKRLVVGVAPWNKFVLFNSKTNEYEGFIVDDIRNFESMTGIKVELVNSTWDGLVAGLQAGKWDVIMSGLGATPQRAMAVAFGDTYGYLSTTAIVQTKSQFQTLSDLDQDDKIISVTSGTAAQQFGQRAFKKAKIVGFTDGGAALLEVMQGRAVAYLGDSVSNNVRAIERSEELRNVIFSKTETEWNSMNNAVRYTDLDLLTFLNTYTRVMQLRGWYRHLAEKWNLPAELAVGPNG